jgi:hypothetical protein
MNDAFPAPDSGILCLHYGRNRLLDADGFAHTRRDYDSEPMKKCHKKQSTIQKQKFDVSVCLTCTKIKCTGDYDCFKKERRKRK